MKLKHYIFPVLFFFSLFVKAQDEEDIIYVFNNNDHVNTVEFSIDDRYIFYGTEDKLIKQWDLSSGEMIKEIEAHYGPVKDIKCLDDGVTILSAGDKVIKSWNNLLEQQDYIWTHHTYVWSFDVNYENRKIISGTYEKKPYIWDLYNQDLIDRPEAHEKSCLAVAFNYSGSLYATGSLDHYVFIWNSDKRETEKAGVGHAENIYDVEFTRDNKFLISVSKDKMVKIWEVSTGGHYKTFTGHTDAVMCVSIHPESRFFVTGSMDGTIRLWDIKAGEGIYSFINHEGPVNDVSFSHDGNYFASASNDNTVIIWKFPVSKISEYFFPEELEKEWSNDEIFQPKRKGESRTEYNERSEKSSEKKREIYLEYYQKVLNSK